MSLRRLVPILERQCSLMNLLVQVEERGPVLQVLLEHMRGTPPEAERVKEMVHAALDAAFYPPLKKVHIFTRPVRSSDTDPSWLTSFAYEPANAVPEDVKTQARRDFGWVRVVYFCIAIAAASFYLIEPAVIHFLPSLIAFTAGSTFTTARRYLPPVWARPVMIVGGVMLTLALLLFWEGRYALPILSLSVALLGSYALGLGWRTQSNV